MAAKLLKNIHPEVREEPAQGDLPYVKKYLDRCVNDLSDDEVVRLLNHLEGNATSFNPNFKEKNPLRNLPCFAYDEKGNLLPWQETPYYQARSIFPN